MRERSTRDILREALGDSSSESDGDSSHDIPRFHSIEGGGAWETIDGIDGLSICRKFLSREDQSSLLSALENDGFLSQISRNQAMRFGNFPWWAIELSDLISDEAKEPPCSFPSELLSREPLFNQLIVNIYQPGEGIAAHVDLMRFEDGIAIVSLESSCVMHFTPAAAAAAAAADDDDDHRKQIPVLLTPGSLVMMWGEARYEWKHGIDRGRPGSQVWNGREIRQERRTSITLRRSESHVYQILAHMILHDLRSAAALGRRFIDYCSDSADLLNAAVFPLYMDPRRKPHTFICNSVLRAFAHSADPGRCREVYSFIRRNSIPVNSYTFPFVLKAAAAAAEDSKSLLREGASLHAQVEKLGFLSDVYVANSLLNLYAACEASMDRCRKVFDEMPLRDVVSWTTVISGLNNASQFDEAVATLNKMRSAGVTPNRVTAVNVLAACAGNGDLQTGRWIHEQVRKNHWKLDTILGTSLVNMYGKCGGAAEASRIFEEMGDERNVYTWNAVIGAFALSENGEEEEAIKYFTRMEAQGIQPNETTLVSVLTSFLHSGRRRLHEARRIFSSLLDGKYGLAPTAKHYSCMIDLLLRSDELDEALELMEGGGTGTASMWGAVVSHCRAKGRPEMSEFAARKLVELEPDNSSHYVLLSNVYAELGRWSDVDRVRRTMKERQLKKDTGSSSLVISSS